MFVCEERKVEVAERTVLCESHTKTICAVTPDFEGRYKTGSVENGFDTSDFITAFSFIPVHQQVLLTTAVRASSGHVEQLERSFGDLLHLNAKKQGLGAGEGLSDEENDDDIGPPRIIATTLGPKSRRKRGVSSPGAGPAPGPGRPQSARGDDPEGQVGEAEDKMVFLRAGVDQAPQSTTCAQIPAAVEAPGDTAPLCLDAAQEGGAPTAALVEGADADPGKSPKARKPRPDEETGDAPGVDARSILSAYFTMLELAQRLKIGQEVIDHAIHLFRMCANSTSVRHRSIDPLATASMVAACRACNKPRALSEACLATGTSERDAARYLKLVSAALEADAATAGEDRTVMDKDTIALHMARVMPKFCKLLALPTEVQRVATHMAEVRGRTLRERRHARVVHGPGAPARAGRGGLRSSWRRISATAATPCPSPQRPSTSPASWRTRGRRRRKSAASRASRR